MRAISKLRITDDLVRDKDLNLLKERHRKTRWWIGLKVFEKEYEADTEIVETRKATGYKQ